MIMIWTPPPEPDFSVKLLFGLLCASIASLYDKSPTSHFLSRQKKQQQQQQQQQTSTMTRLLLSSD